MAETIAQYMARIGREGGKKSRRTLTSAAARDMVKVREARRAYQDFHSECFWSFDPHYRITIRDVPWLADKLMTYGRRRGWEIGSKLCR